jgi:hypothetical protein
MIPRFAVSLLLALTACTIDRGTSPAAQPQRSALSQCYPDHEGRRECRQPMFIVDGKRLVDGAADFNPSDIESVEVFKGPKAIEIYGEDARHGVVVITSRKARLTGNKD